MREKMSARLRPGTEAHFGYHTINSPGRVLFSRPSALGNGLVTVSEHGPWRCMMFDDVEQGIAYFDDDGTPRPDVLGFQYLRVMAAVGMACRQLALGDESAHGESSDEGVLCVGLGTGALPAYLAHHFGARGLRVQVVEIDQLVVDAAREALHCDFGQSSTGTAKGPTSAHTTGGAAYHVSLADAATHLKSVLADHAHARAFGAAVQPASPEGTTVGAGGFCSIFLDAYNAEGETPAHLLCADFLRSCRDALAPGGVVICNVFNGATGSIARANAQRFAAVLAEAVGPLMSFEVPTQEESLVLVARPGPPLARPGARDLRNAARVAWAPSRLARAAARLVRRMYWVETGGRRSLVDFELTAADVARGPRSTGGEASEPQPYLELVPPSTTMGGAPFEVADVMSVLRVGSSAVEWMNGAGPPHGCCPDKGCALEDSGEPVGRAWSD